MLELFNFFLGFFFCVVLVFIIYLLSNVVSISNINVFKVSMYECGFSPFGESRDKFNVHFYLVAILFIIFDLELSFLFPWGVTLDSIGIVSYLVVYFFLLILTIGFLYEWIKGVLDWY